MTTLVRARWLGALALALASACGGGIGTRSTAATAIPPCVIGGCSGELCTDVPLASPCLWTAAYACYRTATCAPQANGACGWTLDDALRACLANAGR